MGSQDQFVGITTKSPVKLSSHPYFWVGVEVEKFGKFFSIRKLDFLQVKSLILVGTLGKCTFLIFLILKTFSICG